MLFFPFLSIGQQYRLVTANESNITIDIQVPDYHTHTVTTPQGEAFVITAPKAMNHASAGEPDLPIMVIPVAIGDNALMTVKVIHAEYTDFENMEVAPSKGDFPRSIDPNDVPYTYGEVYQRNAFFPSQLATLDEPYIHRDVRGQNIVLHPFIYNPVTKTLRAYKHLVVSMTNVGQDTRNVISQRSKSNSLDPEFKAMYQNRYINYTESMAKYNPIEENGELLIICHDAFMNAMQPFVAWKKQIGRPTTMVGTTSTGNTTSSIKSYIQTYYAAHPNLTDILLVGDVAQIPGSYVSAGTGYGGYSGYGDLPYGQLAGDDFYNEVIVGRFCCETEAQVTNHVNKVINYERDLNGSATWLSVGQGISTTAGNGGHYNEDDYQHIDNIRNDLLNYNYSNIYRDYTRVSGSTASNATEVSQHINNGLSIINYCNHGSEIGWMVYTYSNSNVNALTNDFKLPYIISVACLVGKYDYNGGCFAEAWMRATNNSTGNPTGAIGGMFSYISQPWVPPMYGQDEMIDILVESYGNNIRRTMGGVSVNGNMKVLDLGANNNENKGTYNCWILYGDPTLTLRNAVPSDMGVNHESTIQTDATSFTVNATNGNGALATLTIGGEIIGSATISGGSANIHFSAPNSEGEATLTVFGYNKITYSTTIPITSGTSYVPTNVTATTADMNVILSWDPVNDVDSYKVYRNNTLIADNILTTTYTDSNLSPGIYNYQVSSVIKDAESSLSPIIVVNLQVSPPDEVHAELTEDKWVLVTWSEVHNVDFYNLYRNDTLIAEHLTELSYIDEHKGAGRCCYKVKTSFMDNLSQFSNSDCVFFCVAPESVTADYLWKDNSYLIQLGWNKNAAINREIDMFKIYRSRDDDFEVIGEVNNENFVYEYTFNDTTAAIGSYLYMVSAVYESQGCEMFSEPILCQVTSVDENTPQALFYPNPTSGVLNIHVKDMRQLTVINVMGQTMMTQNINNDEVTIDLSTLPNGIYLVTIVTNKGSIEKKINVLK